MITLAHRIERTKSVVGTLLAGLLLLCVADAPRSRADTADWRASAAVISPAAAQNTALRDTVTGARTARSAPRTLAYLPTRAFALDVAAPASSPQATLAPIDRPNAVALRGYDATAPPTRS